MVCIVCWEVALRLVRPVILAHRWYHGIHRLPRLSRELKLQEEGILI